MPDAISYTAAMGKRPKYVKRADSLEVWYSWDVSCVANVLNPYAFPGAVAARLEGGQRHWAGFVEYPTEAAALAAADAAYLRAVADGAI